MTPPSLSFRPTLDEFAKLAAEYSVVPVWRELLGDLETPVGAFRKLTDGATAEGSVLLESVEHGERWGRYSFIGTDPFATFTAHRGQVSWSGRPPAGLPDGPPLRVLRAALERLRGPVIDGLPPLYAGAVGYLAYDVVRELERLPDQTTDDLLLPDGILVFPRSVVVFDHRGQRPSRRAGRAPQRGHAQPADPPARRRPARRRRKRPAARPLPGDGRDRQGAHPRRRHLPGGPIAALLCPHRRRPLRRLPGAAGGQPLPLHVLPAPARRHHRRFLAGGAGHRAGPRG